MNWYQNLKPSEKIAISLIRGNHSFVRCLDEMKICDELPDEQELMRCLAWNRLVPAFYTSVIQNKLLEDYFTSEFLLELQTYHRSSVLQSLQLENIFTTFAPLLQKEDIDFMLFKGIVLAQQVYPTPPLRPILTIDFLVDPKNIDKTKEILIRNGCTPTYDIDSKQTTEPLQQIQLLHYKDVAIEIHQDLFPQQEEAILTQKELFEKALSSTILGFKLRTLLPEHHLVYLVYRLQKHANQDYIKLIWLLDMRLFWKKFQSSIDMNEVERLLHQSKDLYTSLAAIQEILGIEIIDIDDTVNGKAIDQTIQLFLSRSNHKGLLMQGIKPTKILKKLISLRNKLWLIMRIKD